MYKTKTKETDHDVMELLDQIENPRKREDSFHMLAIFQEVTQLQPKIWGKDIIGFGSYHYRYDSGREGTAPLTGFAARKTKFSLYLSMKEHKKSAFLEKLGKYKAGKGCVYVNKLADIDIEVLKQMIQESMEFSKKQHVD
ncbi:DUF1801 domain-containing protein [Rummeliibacillus suwonensis]|uniref:DUF1801 domain-containing protein n=1 Tax=Rummeliibacillus suwonensis TaxID=1306154 RepID=UPI0011B7AB76|nr:DUF1801 domain-containing protein [Rummeliibacillus suwonensis]